VRTRGTGGPTGLSMICRQEEHPSRLFPLEIKTSCEIIRTDRGGWIIKAPTWNAFQCV